jgi:hypothetical protein
MIQHMQESFGETIMMSWPIKDYPLNIRPVRQYLQYDDERGIDTDERFTGSNLFNGGLVDFTWNTWNGTFTDYTYK